MYNHVDLTKVLFFDIETVSAQPDFDALSDTFKTLWKHKAPGALRRFGEELTPEELAASYSDKAGIFAEFGKIVCISVGLVYRKDGRLRLRTKSFANRDEKILLQEFCEMLGQYYNDPNKQFLCGHNIREFDVPWVCRRLIANQLELPVLFNTVGKKPWELNHMLDTLTMWKFGDYKSYTSLKVLAGLLDFPTPKDDIDGSEVGRVFWEEDDLERIAVYCEKDVLATVQLLLRYQLKPILTEEQVDEA